jgi:biotin carboxyl carrier protein
MSKLAITIDGQTFEIEMALTQQCGAECTVIVNGREIPVIVPDLPEQNSALDWMIIDGRPYELTFDKELQWLKAYSGLHRVEIHDQEARVRRTVSGDGRIKAPIPGLITRILVQEGQEVEANQTLFILEAMKMENEIRAPFDGMVRSLPVRPGQTVAQNDVLAELSAG